MDSHPDRTLADRGDAIPLSPAPVEHASARTTDWSALALQAARAGVFVVDATGRVCFANQTALALARRAPRIGVDSFDDCWPLAIAGVPGAGHGSPVAVALADNRAVCDIETTMDRPGGRITLLCSVKPLADDAGAPAGAVVTLIDISERKRAEERLSHLARHDALTGALNRTQFMAALDRAQAAVAAGARPFALLLIRLSGLSEANSGLGAHAGDALLRETARRLRAALNQRDIVGRNGDDEFALLRWLGGEPEREAALFAQSLLSQLAAPFDAASIRAAVGVVVADSDRASDADMIMQRAGQALTDARAGSPSWRLFSPDMAAETEARRRMEGDLRGALQQGDFAIAFQPIVDIGTRETRSVEALVRWRRRDGLFMKPDAFIPLAESTRLIVPLGRWVLGAACKQAAAWRENVKISVNLSAVQIEHDDVVATVEQALRRSGLSPSRLEVEITETALMRDADRALATLTQLRERGVSVALDDFGAGYSSLSYLRMFPFDKIKIDRSFVITPGGRDDSKAIVAAIAGIGRALGMSTVAEGIETEEQLILTRAAGVTQAQGYLIGRPIMNAGDLSFRKTVRIPQPALRAAG